MADILGPLVGQTDSFVKNSQHTASELINLELEEDDILVSHDVVSLFTKTFLRVTHGFIAQGTLYFFMILATVSETFST